MAGAAEGCAGPRHDRVSSGPPCLRTLRRCGRVGEGISELRIHYGPGYRIYFSRDGNTVVILLCGGDKGSQARDINAAKRLLAEWMA